MTKQNSIESQLRNVSSFNNGRISNKIIYKEKLINYEARTRIPDTTRTLI
jgi:hypothetical protein